MGDTKKIKQLHKALKDLKYIYKFRVIFSAPFFNELTPKSWREGIITIPDLEQRSLFVFLGQNS
ncbi:MAG: hypothetical protein C4543_11160 [Ignavibacteriales bacterium]|nr:MAG: hypothetical protein C4543_11160 [Ignavibacteriales bacterium]